MRRGSIYSYCAIALEQSAIFLIPAICTWRLALLIGVPGTIAPLLAFALAAVIWAVLLAAVIADT